MATKNLSQFMKTPYTQKVLKIMPAMAILWFLNFRSSDDYYLFFPYLRNISFIIGIIIGIKYLNKQFYDVETNYYLLPISYVSVTMLLHITGGWIFSFIMYSPKTIESVIDLPFYFMYGLFNFSPLWLFIIIYTSYGYYTGLILVKVLHTYYKYQSKPKLVNNLSHG
ncbi:MAG: hypothetical protein ACXAD7_03355 [Candidatus Kariarchaeaceae archaeon]|jgi:hypothetical protein